MFNFIFSVEGRLKSAKGIRVRVKDTSSSVLESVLRDARAHGTDQFVARMNPDNELVLVPQASGARTYISTKVEKLHRNGRAITITTSKSWDGNSVHTLTIV